MFFLRNMIIITPYYDGIDSDSSERERYLEETINTVDSQQTDCFHLIVDDGNEKAPPEWVSEGENRDVVRREREPNDKLTCSNASNYGLRHVLFDESFSEVLENHQYVTFLHSDDLVLNLHRRREYMENNHLDLLHTNSLIFFDDGNGVLWEGIDGDVTEILRRAWVEGRMPYPTLTWKKEFLYDLVERSRDTYGIDGLFEPSVGCGEDVDVAMRSLELVQQGEYEQGYLPEVTSGYRIHDSSLASTRSGLRRSIEENKILLRHFGVSGAALKHCKRLVTRPECYFPVLYRFVDSDSYELSQFLPKNVQEAM